ncbi:hypothetical protein M427DRAFT_93162 [Gonapodya prolifera JEL478]|uniref:Formamidopyrimidine-DNA glycosylase catalytic domain-containing protein n=1 Tax=Gonapodya prolifera (strain JEL478) TaxID=1344416 RepID=A0A139AYQ6_GONPJ|nr:hypothetical protein M427DRAFT_93162 [Gonapodya prolifera JEL478]|eukprot:KXS21693.1 hypothetical protein M427DRAFT_93162 [Gonapodya prolifera JEL478]
MPELPEVERMRRILHDKCVGKKIVSVAAEEDTIVFENCDSKQFEAELLGKTVVAAGRKGKCFWLELNKPMHVVLHCGMTGTIAIKGLVPFTYKDFNKDASVEVFPPKFHKFVMKMDDGTEVAFTDVRRLGRIRLVNNIFGEKPVSELGFDPLLNMPPLEEFTTMCRKRRVPIKALLLDQNFSAGVGNYVADEVLYRARIHPGTYVQALTRSDFKALHESLAHVVTFACSVNADADKFPRDWLFHYRWTNKKASEVDGMRIEFATVGGRTSAFVPQLQKLRKAAVNWDDESGSTVPQDDEEEEQPAEPKTKKPPPSGSKRKRQQKPQTADAAACDDIERDPGDTVVSRKAKRRVKDVATLDVDESAPQSKKRNRKGQS